jgi:probable 2-oxoglutarate dehydrogenase E1 component DHKTD1
MYSRIRSMPSFPSRYAAALEAEGVLAAGAREALAAKLTAHLDAEFAAAAAFTKEGGALGLPRPAAAAGSPPPPTGAVVGDGSAFAGKWVGLRQAAPSELEARTPTGVPVATLRALGAASVALPPGFRPHDRLLRSHVLPRLAALGYDAGGSPLAGWDAATAPAGLDWATAEALAFGSLLAEGHDVRLAGQDAQRGTFSHRHAVLVDQATGEGHAPLAHLPAPAGRFQPVSTLLSELAALGYELGYSWESPRSLVLWEAQFGDFANCAQAMMDAFVFSGETKWLRQSGLVLLLPHGYDGAGPEHSSARVERYLQLVNAQAVARGAACADPAASPDKATREALNFSVVCPTTPAQYFHVLRRQQARPFRKPLVVVAPKTLLRHAQAVSALPELGPGASFSPLLADSLPGGGGPGATRVLLVAGKLYYELAKRRADVGGAAAADVGIVRVEELAPFPAAAVAAHVAAAYPRARSVTWVQEEPANAGAWAFAEAHLTPALAAAGLPPVTFLGRPALAAPAQGLSKANKAQQDALLAAAVPAA